MRARRLAWTVCTAVPLAASADEDVISLYGRVYVTLESVEARGAPEGRRVRVADQASVFGVRGTSSLAAGLAAFFQLETAFSPEQAGASAFAVRNSGTDLTLGGIAAALNGSGVPGLPAIFDRRDPNVLQYWSPAVGGFALRASHSANEGRTAARNPRASGASVTFAGARAYAGYAYDDVRDAAGSAPRRQRGHAAFGRVDAGAWRWGVLGERFEREGRNRQDAWLANVTWTHGPHQLIYQYQRAQGGGPQSGGLEPRCQVHAAG